MNSRLGLSGLGVESFEVFEGVVDYDFDVCAVCCNHACLGFRVEG